MPRILSVLSKVGGFLPFLVPVFADLSAVGALAGGAAGVAKAVNDANAAKKQLEESKRQNQMIEFIALGKHVYLQPYKEGLGLHIDSQVKNSEKLKKSLNKITTSSSNWFRFG